RGRLDMLLRPFAGASRWISCSPALGLLTNELRRLSGGNVGRIQMLADKHTARVFVEMWAVHDKATPRKESCLSEERTARHWPFTEARDGEVRRPWRGNLPEKINRIGSPATFLPLHGPLAQVRSVWKFNLIFRLSELPAFDLAPI